MATDVDCCVSQSQAPLHVILRPGIWIPGVRTPHLYKETWKVDGSSDAVFKDILGAIEEVSVRCRLRVRLVDEDNLFIRVMSYTKRCSWVDVMEIKIDTLLIQSESGTVVYVRGFSTGFLPAWIPGSFLWNCLLCWVPFSDNGMNEHRMMAVRDAMELGVSVEERGRTC